MYLLYNLTTQGYTYMYHNTRLYYMPQHKATQVEHPARILPIFLPRFLASSWQVPGKILTGSWQESCLKPCKNLLDPARSWHDSCLDLAMKLGMFLSWSCHEIGMFLSWSCHETWHILVMKLDMFLSWSCHETCHDLAMKLGMFLPWNLACSCHDLAINLACFCQDHAKKLSQTSQDLVKNLHSKISIGSQ